MQNCKKIYFPPHNPSFGWQVEGAIYIYFLLDIEWNIQIYTEKLCCPTRTPGVGINCQKHHFARIWMSDPDLHRKVMYANPNSWWIGWQCRQSIYKKIFWLEIELKTHIHTHNSWSTAPTPGGAVRSIY